jgi:hypothetical protein
MASLALAVSLGILRRGALSEETCMTLAVFSLALLAAAAPALWNVAAKKVGREAVSSSGK